MGYGHAVDGDHDRYFRYPGLGHKYNNYGYAKNHGDAVYGYGDLGYAHGGYVNAYKGYGYARELPTVGGVGYVTESKPTGFLYKNARYIGHSSPYVPYTAPLLKQNYVNLGYADNYGYASKNYG